MAAPIGNKFWQLRSKHGRDKLFASPEAMWEAACEYFQWCDDNPLYESKAHVVNGQVEITKIPLMRAYTWQGVASYLHCTYAYFRMFRHSLKDSPKQTDKDFITVIGEIEETLYRQKFEGASANLLNANIIARDLGLSDVKDLRSSDGTMTPSKGIVTTVSEEELMKLINK
jgi:hypothetical protein